MKIPVFLNDLGHLNMNQLRVLGLGKDYMIPHKSYHTRKFNNTKKYLLLKKVVEMIYFFDFLKIKLRFVLSFFKNKFFFGGS